MNCVLCGAHAEKLCLVKPASYAYNANRSYAYDGTGGSAYYGWAVGTGCGNTNKTGALSGFCTTTQAYGIAAYALGQDQPEAGDVTHNNSAGHLCFCRMRYPKTGAWMLFNGYAGQNASNCRSDCAYVCEMYIQSFGLERAAVLASSTP